MENQKDYGKKLAKATSTSASLENQALRDTVSASQCKLMRCEEELKKTKDQLKCLVHLVKKAWTGDIEASIHVANIVGVAPPDLELRGDTNELVAVPKSAVLNNWACLTIGLLNKRIKKDEWERKLNQLVYLREREKFLDNQLDGFVQDPDFRSTEDAANRLTGEMLKNLNEDQYVRQKSTMELQLEIQLQKEKLNEKQQIFKSRAKSHDKRLARNASEYFRQEDLADFEMNVGAAQIERKKIAEKPQRAAKKMTVQRANTTEDIHKTHSWTCPHAQLSTSTNKRPPRPSTAKPVTKSDFKVEVTRKQQRSFSAKNRPLLQANSMFKMVDNVQRKSADNSFRSRDEYKLEHIEKELKRTTSELQKKLNIDPKGCLNFR